jgi:signal transduction histidine kinase
MKLSKKIESEIKFVMDDYWNSYFKGDLEHWGDYLVDDYRNIGGTEEEIWNSKHEILDYTNRMIGQMQGVTELRNKETLIIPYDPYIMVHELLDIYIKIEEEWSFYQKFRLSSLIQNTSEGWKVLHQHGSYPDSKTQEGEAFAFDTLKNENVKLQKAVSDRTIELEHKNRELQIEAAVERVRAQVMAMYQRNDFEKVTQALYTQLTELQIPGMTGVSIYLVDENDIVTVWDLSSPGNISNPDSYAFKYDAKKYPLLGGWVETWKTSNQDYFVLDFPKEVLIMGVEELKEIHPVMAGYLKDAIGSGKLEHQWNPVGKFAGGILSIDLMMPQTDEVKVDVIHTVHKELLNLNIAIYGGSFIAINSQIDTTLRCWGSGGTADTSEEVHIPLYNKPFCTNLINRIKSGLTFFTEVYTQKEKKDFFTFLFNHEPWSKLDPKQKKETLNSSGGYTRSCCVSQHTSIFIINHFGEKFSEADNDILKRFGKVFEQTYTRFLDLQKAEAQAREAQIEAALEKVRSRSLAMHKSDELNEIVSIVFEKLKDLQIPATAVGISIPIEGSKDLDGYVCGENEAGLVVTNYRLPYFDHPIPKDLNNSLDKQIDFFVGQYSKEEKNEFYQYLFDHVAELRHLPIGIQRMIFDSSSYTISIVAVKNAVFNINDFEGKLLSANEVDIIKRFARVFDQAYVRFLDLQKAEAQAREAQIELSLERIRAQVTSMQESSELLDIVVMMRNEFVTLGHEANYFWHMRWLPDRYEKAMTSGDGTRIGMVMTLPRHMHSDIKLVADWEKSNEPIVVYAMDVDAAVDYVDKMISLGDFEIVDPNAPTLDDIRHIGGLTFVMARTTHGEIGYSLPGNVPNPSGEAQATLVRFAGVFDLAYKRFLDLQLKEHQSAKLKEEKERLELTLSELKATQTQLVHSEKMASLGELTAGIAHEIQNPLNFVNNFCEVNEELITELQDEARAGNTADVLTLATAVDKNLKIIIHHGKRADLIVKGMLQHSRTDSGKKELADINSLVDEYLRLCYHGLRVKDKSFNALYETHFDPTVGVIEVIPQEISRVLLNLFSNAFYTVHEKMKGYKNQQPVNTYEPTVSVRTKRSNNQISISVKDNGDGIPKKIIDKIFQPFFTTKPTGEGTGLGLSLSYDIVKAHGGEMKVETKEGEGSEFILLLSTN